MISKLCLQGKVSTPFKVNYLLVNLIYVMKKSTVATAVTPLKNGHLGPVVIVLRSSTEVGIKKTTFIKVLCT